MFYAWEGSGDELSRRNEQDGHEEVLAVETAWFPHPRGSRATDRMVGHKASARNRADTVCHSLWLRGHCCLSPFLWPL